MTPPPLTTEDRARIRLACRDENNLFISATVLRLLAALESAERERDRLREIIAELPKDTGQAAAWIASFEACLDAGMDTNTPKCGRDLVVDFIRDLAAERDRLRQDYADLWERVRESDSRVP